jgi:hypothetical protein
MDKRGNLGIEYESLCGVTAVVDTTDIDAVDDGCWAGDSAGGGLFVERGRVGDAVTVKRGEESA